jgi:transposase
MPAVRISMRKIKEILRLRFESGLSYERIALACSVSKGVVTKYVNAFQSTDLIWPLPESLDDTQLEQQLLGRPKTQRRRDEYEPPQCEAIHQALKHKGVTLQLLWEEYQQSATGRCYSYTQFCVIYREYKARLQRSMRQVHRAGEKLFIDYCGPTVAVVDAATGEIRQAQIFVAVMGASNYTYAEATWTQGLADWVDSHVRTFEFLGGVPTLLVPDNLKSAIDKACRYDPEVNSSYAELAAHYGCAVLPARPYKPKDKAKVEAAVLLVQRWILARLRHHTFFSLAELNGAIAQLLVQLNNKNFKKLPGCRQPQFELIDRPALQPLPAQSYEFAQWKKARVNIDYHIEFDAHYYSVPHALVKHSVEVRYTARTVECFYQGKRVAAHVRNHRKGAHTTLTEHMPKAHQKHMQWTPGRFLNWAKDIGPGTLKVVKHLLENKPHPEHGYRTCLGLLNLVKQVGPQRLEAACTRAWALGSPTRKSVCSILDNGLERQPLPQQDSQEPTSPETAHDNIRGADYYH